MKKLKLHAEMLSVQSFSTTEPSEPSGTVRDPGGCICFAPPCICTAGPDCTGPQ